VAFFFDIAVMDDFNWLKTGTLTKIIIVTDKLKYHEGRADNKRQIFVVFFWVRRKSRMVSIIYLVPIPNNKGE